MTLTSSSSKPLSWDESLLDPTFLLDISLTVAEEASNFFDDVAT